ncbi:MAG: hypothetical protein J6B85_02905 [Lachnospiraceae bacterium]|nr:hypothetical protein [Lachnospiraceae bacterium]
MSGRYGVDELSRACLTAALICIVLSLFVAGGILSLLSMILLVICYVRMFSRNRTARMRENQKYLELTAPVRRWMDQQRRDRVTRKTHHIYKCPGCGQRIRIPKGKGKICVTCPKCRREFTKKS